MKNRSFWFLVATVLAIVIIPFFLNLAYAPPGAYPQTVLFSVPSDTLVYENYLNQVRDGNWRLFDEMTTESQKIGIVNVYWLFWGLIGKWTGISSTVTLLIAQLASAPALIAALWFFSGLWVKGRERIAAVYFVTFLSGLGWLTYLLTGEFADDFVLQQSLIYNELINSPHIAISTILLVACHWLVFRFVESKRPRHLLSAGLMGILLLQFHPYFIFSLFLTSLAWVLIRRKTFSANDFGFYFLYLAALSLPILYHALTIILDPFTRLRYATNVTGSAPALRNLIAFAPILFLAYYGVRERIKTSLWWQYSFVWFATNVGLMYLPFPINQRFIQGLIFPVGFAAYLGLRELLKTDGRVRLRLEPYRALVIPALAVMLFGGTFVKAALAAQHAKVTYFDGDFGAMLSKLRTMPKANVLSIPKLSLFIAGRGHQKVYVAHWSETVRYQEKAILAARVLTNTAASEEARNFLDSNSIRYVLASRQFLPAYSFLDTIFENQHYVLFAVSAKSATAAVTETLSDSL